MDLYLEILSHILRDREMQITFPGLEADVNRMVSDIAYQTLVNIKRILEDDSLSDEDCFLKIEHIICLFEAIGSDGGYRHDFG